jgi:hypothetical protein
VTSPAEQPAKPRMAAWTAGILLAMLTTVAAIGLHGCRPTDPATASAPGTPDLDAIPYEVEHGRETSIEGAKECCRAAQHDNPRAMKALTTILLQNATGWKAKREVLAVLNPGEAFRHILHDGKPYLLATGSYSVSYAGLTEADWALHDRFNIPGRTITPVGCEVESKEEGQFRNKLYQWVSRYNQLVIAYYIGEELKSKPPAPKP